MGRQNISKLNQLISTWPAGTVYTCSALDLKGYSAGLISHYRNFKWLRSMGNGAVARSGDVVDWSGGLYAIQQQLGLKIHVGGKTALLLQGAAHFLPLGNAAITLYGDSRERLPTWFNKFHWKEKIVFYKNNLFSSKYNLGLEELKKETFSVKISSRERAILELLFLVPTTESFEDIRLIMEGMYTLRPNLLQRLLECCGSVKVKRLFLLYGEELGLPWLKKLNIKAIDLGHGKRQLVKNGRLYSKYQVTIPLELFMEEQGG